MSNKPKRIVLIDSNDDDDDNEICRINHKTAVEKSNLKKKPGTRNEIKEKTNTKVETALKRNFSSNMEGGYVEDDMGSNEYVEPGGEIEVANEDNLQVYSKSAKYKTKPPNEMTYDKQDSTKNKTRTTIHDREQNDSTLTKDFNKLGKLQSTDHMSATNSTSSSNARISELQRKKENEEVQFETQYPQVNNLRYANNDQYFSQQSIPRQYHSIPPQFLPNPPCYYHQSFPTQNNALTQPQYSQAQRQTLNNIPPYIPDAFPSNSILESLPNINTYTRDRPPPYIWNGQEYIPNPLFASGNQTISSTNGNQQNPYAFNANSQVNQNYNQYNIQDRKQPVTNVYFSFFGNNNG